MPTEITTVKVERDGVKKLGEARRIVANRCRGLRCLFATLIGVVISGQEVVADPIEVTNPSFELPALALGEFTSEVVDGWEATTRAGVLYPQDVQFTLPLPAGNS